VYKLILYYLLSVESLQLVIVDLFHNLLSLTTNYQIILIWLSSTVTWMK